MTDHERSQLRSSLMAQFQQMMTEELPPIPDEYLAQSQTPEWALKH